jgi:uncharacterized membrane protein
MRNWANFSLKVLKKIKMMYNYIQEALIMDILTFIRDNYQWLITCILTVIGFFIGKHIGYKQGIHQNQKNIRGSFGIQIGSFNERGKNNE